MRNFSSGIIILAVSVSFLLFGCDAPSNSSSSSQNNIEGMEDLNIPAGFDWKTTRDINFRLTGYSTARVQIMSDDGSLLHQANLIEDQEYSFKLTIPAYKNDLKVVYKGKEVRVNATRSNFVHSFTP